MFTIVSEESPQVETLDGYPGIRGLGNGQIIFKTDAEMPNDLWAAVLSVVRDYCCGYDQRKAERRHAQCNGHEDSSCPKFPGEQRNISFAFDIRRLDETTYSFVIMPEYSLVDPVDGVFHSNEAYEEHFLQQFSWICCIVEEYLDRFFADEDGYAAIREVWQPDQPLDDETRAKLWQIRDNFAIKTGYRLPKH